MTQWQPGSDLDLSPQSRLLLAQLFQADPLFAKAGQTALEMTGTTLSYVPEDEMDSMSPQAAAGDADGLTAHVVQQLQGETRIASFSLSGWDTHSGQPPARSCLRWSACNRHS